MHDNFGLTFAVIMCPISSIFVILGLFFLLRDGNKKRCRYLLKGTVIEMLKCRDSEGNRTWKPRFCYTFNDIDYKVETPYSSSNKRFQVGDEVEIYIDEKHPEVFWIPSEAKLKKLMGIIFILVGSLNFMAGVAAGILL